jgi:hypothetical protein
MPTGLPKKVSTHLRKCQAAAMAAVEVYNKPGPQFRTAHYLVMISIAWTALFHAIFYKRDRRPWYRKRTSGSGKAIRYRKIDGEPVHWDLSECLSQFYGSQNPPERSNLEFLIGLRNKIEHRSLPELDASLYGECQASLLNLEALLTTEFGPRYALTEQLAVSLQFSRIVPPEKRRAARVLASSTARTVVEYVEKFRGKLPATVLNSTKYSFNVFLVPKVVNRESASDMAVQFVRVDEGSPEEVDRLEKLNVLIREKHIPIANLDLLTPSKVVRELSSSLPHTMNVNIHTACWKYFRVRPPAGATEPEKTDPTYCVYDPAHRDYLYTRAWINRLAYELRDSSGFERVTGWKPKPR